VTQSTETNTLHETKRIAAPTYLGPDCRAQHGGLRYVGRGTCVACIAESARAYRRANRDRQRPLKQARRAAWRKANPDRRREEREAYKARNAERLAAAKAERQAASREATARARAMRRAERDRIKSEKRAKREAWLADTTRRRIMRDRAKAAQRRALKRGATGAATADQIAVLKALQGCRCAYCGTPDDLTLDHRTPVSRGGQHVVANLQWLCAFHNTSKLARTDAEYRYQRGIPRLTPWDVATGLYRLAAEA
jgi:5-methylcytosine-specific restriction endonuclease McrA